MASVAAHNRWYDRARAWGQATEDGLDRISENELNRYVDRIESGDGIDFGFEPMDVMVGLRPLSFRQAGIAR